jgi:hypothetical protein
MMKVVEVGIPQTLTYRKVEVWELSVKDVAQNTIVAF